MSQVTISSAALSFAADTIATAGTASLAGIVATAYAVKDLSDVNAKKATRGLCDGDRLAQMLTKQARDVRKALPYPATFAGDYAAMLATTMASLEKMGITKPYHLAKWALSGFSVDGSGLAVMTEPVKAEAPAKQDNATVQDDASQQDAATVSVGEFAQRQIVAIMALDGLSKSDLVTLFLQAAQDTAAQDDEATAILSAYVIREHSARNHKQASKRKQG